MWRKVILKNDEGSIMPLVVSFIVAASIIGAAVLQVILTNFSIAGNNVQSQQAFNIAEAGVNYYLWHLSHNSSDYKDGQSTPSSPDPSLGYGPYTHNYIDDKAVNEGTFTLWVKPQSQGSTIVTVRSIGTVKGTNITRTVEAKLGATSFAGYAVLSDSALWFGNTEEADGPVHSNQGVRMDGSNDDKVTSANATYTPSSSVGGDGSSHPGVWCSLSVTSPVDCATRSKSDWSYPTTAIDFNQVSGSLCTIKKLAFASVSSTASLANQSNACSQTPTTRTAAYLPQRSSSANDSRGYLIQLNPNGTYDLYTVNNVNDTKSGYSNALNYSQVQTGITIPSSGVIFAEDNVWVRSNSTYHGRVTIASGRLATSVTTNITVADNLAYSTKDGNDAVGLVAEGSFYVAPFAAPASGNFTLEIDGAVLAANGDVEYPSNYTFSNSNCSRGWVGNSQKLNFYGSIAVRQTWTWSWLWNSHCGDNVYDAPSGYYISGFKNNTTHYDYNLLYSPPPSFPVTGGYETLSWREVLTHP